jgi:cytochrome P450
LSLTSDMLDNEINLLSGEVLENPYPTYAYLRATDPVRWDDTLQGWIVSRYDDVYGALRDPKRFSSDRVERLLTSRVPESTRSLIAPFVNLAAQWMWMLDPPQHTRLRRLMNKGFLPRAVQSLRPLIEETVNALLDKVAGQDRMDLIRDFAYPLPAIILADVYGIPRADADLLKHWSDALKVFIGGSPELSGTAADAIKSIDEMMGYFRQAIGERRTAPREDLISRLVRAEEDGEFLSETELCSNLLLVLAASYVTTMDMIGNGMLALLQQRDQWNLLRFRPDLVPIAIDELLRYDGPVQLTHRLATENIELRGKRIRKGDIVYLLRASANRDAERFSEPDRVDVTRRDIGHVAFGAGVHYCIGAVLARQEGEVAFGELLRRFPAIQFDPQADVIRRTDTLQFRGLRTFPVLLRAT